MHEETAVCVLPPSAWPPRPEPTHPDFKKNKKKNKKKKKRRKTFL